MDAIEDGMGMHSDDWAIQVSQEGPKYRWTVRTLRYLEYNHDRMYVTPASVVKFSKTVARPAKEEIDINGYGEWRWVLEVRSSYEDAYNFLMDNMNKVKIGFYRVVENQEHYEDLDPDDFRSYDGWKFDHVG